MIYLLIFFLEFFKVKTILIDITVGTALFVLPLRTPSYLGRLFIIFFLWYTKHDSRLIVELLLLFYCDEMLGGRSLKEEDLICFTV